MSTIYFSGDFHAGEVPEAVPAMVATHSYLRPGRTDKLMNLWFKQFHKILKPTDTLVLNGDLAINLESLDVYQNLPKCRKILVKGDKEYSGKLFTEEDLDQKLEDLQIFDEIYHEWEVEIDGITYYVAHEPVNCFDKDMPAICGHVHGVWRTQQMPNGHPIINVAIDAWGGLVSEDFISHQYGAIVNGYYDIHCRVDKWHEHYYSGRFIDTLKDFRN